MDLGMILVFISTAILLLYCYLLWANTYWKRKGIIYDPPQLFFGSLGPKFKGEKHFAELIIDLYRKYSTSPFVGIYKLWKPAILLRDPEIIKDVLVKNFNQFHDNDFPIAADSDPIISRNPFILKGEDWRITRSRLTPGFTNTKIKSVYSNMHSVTDDLKNYILKHTDGLNTKELCAKFTTDVVAKSIFGINGNSFENENAEFLQMGTNIIATDFLSSIRLSIIELFPKIAKILKLKVISSKVEKFFKNLINETNDFRKKNNIERNDFFNLLMQLKSKYPDFNMNEVTSHAILFFSDGFETSSTALGMALYELALNPEVQAKARAEVDQLFDKYGQLTFEAIVENLPYVENCLYESMRIHPPVTYMQRICTEPVELMHDGKTLEIEPGTSALISILALHHDEQYFPEPKAFKPERFSEEESKNRHRFAFLPFGEGPRICLGIKFALTQTKLGLATILRHFEIVKTKETPEQLSLSKLSFLMIYKPEQTPIVGFKERKHS